MPVIGPPLRCYLVEWYHAALVGETVDHYTTILDDCATSISAEGARVRVLTVFAVPADEVVFGIFAAASAGLVARTCARAGVPAHRLSEAIDARASHL